MIRNKRPTRGSVPADLDRLDRQALAGHLVRLQAERVELTVELTELRDRKDAAGVAVTRAKGDADRQARATLEPAKGKTEPPASAIKLYVDSDEGVVAAKEALEGVARDVAANDAELGAVRSGLRVVGAVMDHRLEEVRDAREDRELARRQASGDW